MCVNDIDFKIPQNKFTYKIVKFIGDKMHRFYRQQVLIRHCQWAIAWKSRLEKFPAREIQETKLCGVNKTRKNC